MEKRFAYKLNIADFIIELVSDELFLLEDGYESFLAEIPDKAVDIFVNCSKGLPENILTGSKVVFDAENEVQKYYTIYKKDDELFFVVHSQQKKDTIQQIACPDKNFKSWKVYSNEEDEFVPLKYPLGPIIMHYMTVYSEAVLMHASCAFDGKDARIFTGFSGAGKSTMSKLWSQAGNRIINDDRLIVRKIDGKYQVYNTPMYYTDISKKATLSSVYLISHSPENRIKRLSGVNAISRMMAFSIQNNFDSQYIQTRLQFFSELCMEIPVYDIGFVPDMSVVQFILENEAQENK